uniref:Uncharacterized protein n=1 Tax=Rhizophora mucronata TaxID=61149 RepID=A0A2P2QA56_RHIMU
MQHDVLIGQINSNIKMFFCNSLMLLISAKSLHPISNYNVMFHLGLQMS